MKKTSNVGVMYGVMGGVVAILITVILYLGGVSWFTNPLAYLAFAVPIVFAVLAGIKQKKLNGGYIEFKPALKTVFLTFVIYSAFSTVFQYLLFNVIDVPFREALMQEAAMKSEAMFRKFGMSDEQIDKATAEMMNSNNYTIGKTLLNFAYGLIFWFVISLIIAAIVKKKKPPFENSFNTQA